ncbi:MAG: hypothetical protein ACLS43_06995 [Evtepia gabavorous]
MTCLGTLRRRFAQEQATMAAYLPARRPPRTLPPAVVLGARQEAWDQACKIRTLVEQA